MSEIDELRAEVIALRALVIRDLRREHAAHNNDPTWESTIKVELMRTLAMIKRPQDIEPKIKAEALELIDEALFGPRPNP
jgi:hypothetical protein